MLFFRKAAIVFLIFTVLLMQGCSMQEASDKKVSDVSFTVISEEDAPEALLKAIEEKKREPFKLSYCDEKDMYLVVGYGKQPTGGYSIVVDEFYKTENTLVFATTLKGPGAAANISDAETYPYIIAKTEYIDYEIIYK